MEEAKYRVGDEEVTLDELIRGYMRQADYTRKTQALAEERRRLEAEMREIRAEADRAKRWDEWYYANKEFITQNESANRYAGEEPYENEDAEIRRLRADIAQLAKAIEYLEREGRKQLEALNLENQKLSRALRYSFDLDALKDRHLRKHPDIPFDRDKIIDRAFDYNKADLDSRDWEAIYNQVYRDEFINKDVERRVSERLKSEEDKLKAARSAEAGEFIKPLKLPETPSTDQATLTQDVINILREERSKRGE